MRIGPNVLMDVLSMLGLGPIHLASWSFSAEMWKNKMKIETMKLSYYKTCY